ncbi:alpha/beta hydrolase [Actinacidiphila soli]|uniref:alpha/beta hydrolase n=1 Tax=Actinacidiphila soli TaxID=2487275 RepID=UPI001F0B8FE6|nr:alpha/beta hydrolase [Actinacidiphila soli]
MGFVDERFSSPSLRALLALAVVFVMLATTGWTALHHSKGYTDPRTAAAASWLKGSVGGRHLPSPEAGADAVAHFFATLTLAQRQGLAARYPLVVGNLNGAPVSLRYQANRIALAAEEAAQAERSHSTLLTADGRQEAGHLANRYASLLSDGRQILAFDPTGRGRAAEVFGNLSTAKRISVVVPGVDTDILTFERTVKAYSSPVGMARSLYAAEQAAQPSAHTAVIAWADYTTPSGVGLDASTGELAELGAKRLNSLLSSLPAGSQVSLFCHSYGSVLCGVAAPSLPGTGATVSDIAVFGSPGMRVQRASDLHTTAHVWATRDATDWISDVPHLEFAGLGHGADPVSHAFGARVIDATGAQGHTGYFREGTGSLANFTRIALGTYSSIRCATGAACTAGVTSS